MSKVRDVRPALGLDGLMWSVYETDPDSEPNVGELLAVFKYREQARGFQQAGLIEGLPLPRWWRTVLPDLFRLQRQHYGHNGSCPSVDGPDELFPGRPCTCYEIGVAIPGSGMVVWWWGADVDAAVIRAANGIEALAAGKPLRESEGFLG